MKTLGLTSSIAAFFVTYADQLEQALRIASAFLLCVTAALTILDWFRKRRKNK